MKDELLRLAALCEKAEGPDRELDVAIARVMRTTVLLRNDEDTANYETTHWRYTASIDAALTLVPEGWSFSLGEMMGLPLDRRWRCYLRDHNEPYNPATCAWLDCECRTPALAVCAAALRARASMENLNGD